MSHVSAKKVFIQIESAAEQQEHIKNQNQRKTLKVLQGVATDKENLTGRPQIDRLSRLKAATTNAVTLATSGEHAKRKKVETRAAETQTSPVKAQPQLQPQNRSITVDDLTGDAPPSEYYWERLAEKRREALEESLVENAHLYELKSGLEAELNTSRQMLEEARNLVEVLTEMLNENEAEREIEAGGGDGGDEDDDEEVDPQTAKAKLDDVLGEGSETRSSTTTEQADKEADQETKTEADKEA